MNKHWENLLITNDTTRRVGLTIKTRAHGDLITGDRTRQADKRDKEMGAAFCSRASFALSTCGIV